MKKFTPREGETVLVETGMNRWRPLVALGLATGRSHRFLHSPLAGDLEILLAAVLLLSRRLLRRLSPDDPEAFDPRIADGA